jgi:hypothetical protein
MTDKTRQFVINQVTGLDEDARKILVNRANRNLVKQVEE